jgi:murein DD-endopeptidase MepM/ murein hydrolase activator NlpD
MDSVNWPLPAYLYGYEDSETDLPHSGLDFDAPLHTPILAAASGKVVFTGYGLALGKGNTKDPYGLAVVIRHDFSYYGYSILTVYGHMEKVIVEAGQSVKAGDEIGFVGLTGNTSGPHVHYEVRIEKNGTYYVQNPFLWMAPPVDSGVLVGRFVDAYDKYITAREVWITSLSTGENWTVKTYAAQDVPNDPYYKENVVLGDLPSGNYLVTYLNNYQYYKLEFTINPGVVTFVYFKSGEGFETTSLDPAPLTGFTSPTP